MEANKKTVTPTSLRHSEGLLRKANVPLKSIREQLKMSEHSLHEITELWSFQMDNNLYLKALVESMPRRLQPVVKTRREQPIAPFLASEINF